MRWFGWRRRDFRRSQQTGAANSSLRSSTGSRRHAADVPYALPQDTEEINRLDFQHYLLRYAFHGNFAAPLRDPHAILDVGCGTGRWAREMAQAFPSARALGWMSTPLWQAAMRVQVILTLHRETCSMVCLSPMPALISPICA